jgi:hypothetical protein
MERLFCCLRTAKAHQKADAGAYQTMRYNKKWYKIKKYPNCLALGTGEE